MQKPMSSRALRIRMILFGLLSTQALITSVKTLYLIHFLMQDADISLFKLVFTLFAFGFELPSGYFSDRYGNRYAVLLSRILIAASFVFYLVVPSFPGFLLANVILGMADAWESGAKDSYFLALCTERKMDYQQLKIQVTQYGYGVNFVLAFFSTILYTQNIYLPILITILFYVAASFLLLAMPVDSYSGSVKGSQSFLSLSGQIMGKIFRNKLLMIEMLFATTCTSILISNFDFFSPIFESAGISVEIIGMIYSSFGLINILGVKLYDRFRSTVISKMILLLMPFSFLLLVSGKVLLILAGVFLQELCFSYYSLNLNLCVIDSIDDLTSSSYYQSMISFMTVLMRIGLTVLITIAFKILAFHTVYSVFMVLTLCVTIFYFCFKRMNFRH